MKKFCLHLFAFLFIAISLSSCENDNNEIFVNGVVRDYTGQNLSNCGFVIEIINAEGNLEVLKPLNLDPAFEIDNFVVNLSFDETGAQTTCNQGALIIIMTDILINQIN